MQHIWAPWRMAYVGVEQPEGCIFCVKPAEDRDLENYIVRRSTHAFVMLNAFPYNTGHLLVAPYRHTADFAGLQPEETADMMRLAQEGVEVLNRAFKPEGCNMGMNLGRVAGAGIAEHLHLHLVPRWGGDTNFMTVCADVRVLPEALADTHRRLREAWETR